MQRPTTRKVRNRGFTPVRYRSRHECRHGWLIEVTPRGVLRVQLVGEERVRRLPAAERRYVTALSGSALP